MNKNSKKIVLTGPPGDFYKRIIRSLGRGFNKIGFDVYWSNQISDDNKFYEYVNSVNPILLFEINKILKDRILISKKVIHATWFQDYRFNGLSLLDNFGCSDKFYFLINPDVWNIDQELLPNYTILSPGVDTHENIKNNVGSEIIDFSFAGFIPDPLNLNHIIQCKNTKNNIPLNRFLALMDLHPFMQSTYSAEGMYIEINKVLQMHGMKELKNSDLHLLDEILPRTIERSRIIKMALGISDSLELYGPENWLKWPTFKGYYKGNINDLADLNKVYSKTRINIHNGGLSMHFRVLECMANKSFIALNKTGLDNKIGGILESFEPETHFAHYSIDNFSEVCADYLKDTNKRHSIVERAYAEVSRSHTWMHRAKQVARDLDILEAPENCNESYVLKEISN